MRHDVHAPCRLLTAGKPVEASSLPALRSGIVPKSPTNRSCADRKVRQESTSLVATACDISRACAASDSLGPEGGDVSRCQLQDSTYQVPSLARMLICAAIVLFFSARLGVASYAYCSSRSATQPGSKRDPSDSYRYPASPATNSKFSLHMPLALVGQESKQEPKQKQSTTNR